MALPHAQPGSRIDVSPYGDLPNPPPSHALIRSTTLEVIRLVLNGGDRVPPHTSRREQTLHCLEGLVSVQLEDRLTMLQQGELMLLSAGMPHAIKALEQSSLLLTICLIDSPPATTT